MTEVPRILYISDSLGTPIHPRGIFNYSVSLIEVLQRAGADVTLLVEGAPGYGFPTTRARKIAKESKTVVDVVRLAELMRYFHDGRFVRWLNLDQKFGSAPLFGSTLAGLLRRVLGLRQFLGQKLAPKKPVKFRNHRELIDFVPSKVAHLALPDAFAVGQRFYSSTMYAGANSFMPVEVDATGYDAVVIDTPHYVKIKGVPSSSIVTVIHDLIPLQDPTMSADWRLLFVKKLEATLANNAIAVFVSETTREAFYTYFAHRRSMPNFVVYPLIRSNLMEAAARTAGAPKVRLDELLSATLTKTIDRIKATSIAAETTGASTEKSDLGPKAFDWTLPFFVTPTSDEPRKNIGNLVKAFAQLRGRANLVVVGEVDGNRYLSSIKGADQNIIFTGYVSDIEKNTLIRHAHGLVFPSFAEGFGIPIAEGGVFEKPVLCSNIPVFREITAGHAFLFDPADSFEIVQAVLDVLADDEAAQGKARLLHEHVLETFSQTQMLERVKAILKTAGAPVA
ncbi:glycosyltransferase family 4 protein [Methyloraptor flagellatus]|uniref:Glycosyltransferase family 1 protein n=1 Tax=Methyloraptor flagellatus TaxID=3162530 RepID=A0AAU7XAX4_9HYPH